MKHYFFVFLVIVSFTSYSQTISKIDFEDVKREVKNPNSKHHLDTLMARFMKGDSSMHLEEFSYLYYGQVFSTNYRPYFASEDEVTVVESLRGGKYSKAIKAGEKVLKEYPIHLTMYYYMSISHRKEGNILEANMYAWRYKSLLKAIMDSGDGSSEDDAYVVIKESDELEVIREKGLRKLAKSHEGEYNKISVEFPNKYYSKAQFFILTKPSLISKNGN